MGSWFFLPIFDAQDSRAYEPTLLAIDVEQQHSGSILPSNAIRQQEENRI